MSEIRGEPSDGIEFYNLLYNHEKFCIELGKSTLASGRLETELINYINKSDIGVDTRRATLGKLIGFAKKHELLEKMIPALELIKNQRNYLTHNIYALFSGIVEETILQSSELLDSDVHTFTERAWQLNENITALADIISKHNKQT